MSQYCFGISVHNGLVQAVSFQNIQAADLPIVPGLNPGGYNSANIVIDQFGRIVQASNGGSAPIQFDAASNFFLGGGGHSVNGDVVNDLGTDNIGIGAQSIDSLFTLVGPTNPALFKVTSGVGNVAIGAAALEALTTGDYNVAIGDTVLISVSSGVNNIGIGNGAGIGITSGQANLCLGAGSAGGLTTGRQNVFVGISAGGGVAGGINNTFLGTASRASQDVSNSIVLGYNAIVANSQQCVIGSTNGSGSEVCLIWAGSTAPANADLSVSQGSLFWDFTPGSSALLTKGKDNNGTVFNLRLEQPTSRVASNNTNATTTFQNITGVSHGLEAGRNFVGRLVLKCNNSTAAEGIKLDFNGGTATMSNFWAAAAQFVGGTVVAGTVISTALAGVINFSTITGETVIVIEFSGVVNQAGTLIPRFAENTSATGTATVELGSFLWVQDTP